MLTGSVSVGSTAPVSKEMTLQINVFVEEKETAVFKAAMESLNLLLCGSKEAGMTLR